MTEIHPSIITQEGFHPRRQINTLLLFITALCNSIIVQALSAINYQVTQYLDVSPTQVSACALLFMIVHPCVAIPVNYVLDHYPLKLAISIDCCMVLLGVCMRTLVLNGFAWVIIGNIIVAVGNAFILYCPAKYSAIWYPPKKRLLITGLIIFANNVSGGIGAFISSFFVKPDMEKGDGRTSIELLMIFQAALVGSVMLANLIFFKGNPQRLNMFTKSTGIEKKQPYQTVLLKLFLNKQFLLSFFSVLLFLSVLNSLLTNIQLLITPFGLGSKQAGLSAILVLPAALIGSVGTSMVVKKTLKYKLIILIQITSSIFSLALIFLALVINFQPLFWTAIIIFGLFGFPVLPTIIQYTCESMHPVGEATVSGLLIAGGQLVSFLLGISEAQLVSDKSQRSAIIVFCIGLIFLIGALILMKFSTQNLRRIKEKNKSEIGASLFSESDDSHVSSQINDD